MIDFAFLADTFLKLSAALPVTLGLFISAFVCGGLLALAAYLAVGVAVPLVTSRLSGDDGMRLRTKSGELSAFVLDSLRGLPEIQQYGRGADRLGDGGDLVQDGEEFIPVLGALFFKPKPHTEPSEIPEPTA